MHSSVTRCSAVTIMVREALKCEQYAVLGPEDSTLWSEKGMWELSSVARISDILSGASLGEIHLISTCREGPLTFWGGRSRFSALFFLEKNA